MTRIGYVPLGYDLKERKLVVNKAEAAIVRDIFKRFVEMRSATALAQALAKEGVKNKRGKPIDKGFIYKLLNNRVYLGEAVHKGTAYPGEHEAIVSRELWNRAHEVLKDSPRTRAAQTRALTPALLKGLIFGPDGVAMSPTHTRKRGRLYRYYLSQSVVKRGAGASTITRVGAAEIETAVIDQMRGLLKEPEFIVSTWRAMCDEEEAMSETEVRAALERLDPLWEELFPAEQAQVVRLMIRRVNVRLDGIDISFRVEGLARIARDLKPITEQRSAA